MAVGIDIASHFWGDDKGTPLIPPPLSAVIIDSSIRMDEYSLAGLYLPLETNDRWIPYGRLAPGYYRLIGKVNTTSGDLKQAFDCFGLAVGAGVVYRLNGRFGVSADATYRHVWGREGLEFDPQDTTVGLGLLIGFAP
jgi:Outer membrane protein beta-barrel domain